MKILAILQGRAYGDKCAYNALRVSGNLAKRAGTPMPAPTTPGFS